MKHNTIQSRNDETALAGVSALIVFIALVLVSAIAAGVILDTAGFLQEKASTTGEQSAAKVSDNLDISAVIGVVNETDNPGGADYNYSAQASPMSEHNVTQVRLDVLKAPGANRINMEDVTTKIVANSGSDTLAFNTSDEAFQPNDADPVRDGAENTTSNDGINYSVKDIRDTDASYPIINDQTDRFQVRVNFTGPYGTSLEPIEESSDIEIRLTTASGAQSFKELDIPTTIPRDSGATLQL